MSNAVIHAADDHRYEIRVDGDLAGFVEYERNDGRYVFTHTEIDSAFEGQGLGSQLARGALDDVRAQHQLVVPVCPFIASWIDKHPDHADLVDDALRRQLTGPQ